MPCLSIEKQVRYFILLTGRPAKDTYLGHFRVLVNWDLAGISSANLGKNTRN